jgi:hypothetical protein
MFTWQAFILFLAFICFVVSAALTRRSAPACLLAVGLALWVLVEALTAAGVGT